MGDWTFLTNLGNNYSTTGEITNERAYEGTYSVRLTVGNNAANGALANDVQEVAPGSTIRYRVWIAADQIAAINGIQPFLQHGSGWSWVDQWYGAGSLTANEWNTLEIVVPENAGVMQRIGLQVTGANQASTATVYIDSITISGAAQDDDVMTIAEARAAGAGETVTIEGVVTRTMGAFTYIQDHTAGLAIRQPSGAFRTDVNEGNIRMGTELRITGTISEFRHLLQINAADLASYEILGTTDVPAPHVITLQDLMDGGETYEGQLVEVRNLETEATGTFAAATTYTVTDATGSGELRIPNASDTNVDGTEIPDGAFIFTGVVGQFSVEDPAAGYQLLAIEESDIWIATEVEPSEFAFGFETLEGLNYWVNTSSDPGLVLSLSDDAVEGNTSLMFDYDFVADQSWGGSVDIQRMAPGGVFVDMSDYDGISLYYKVLDPISNVTDANFAIKFGDYSTGETIELWEYRTASVITDATGEWQRLEIPFDSFVLPAWVAQGDGELDLDSIVRWEMQVVVGGGGTGNTYAGTILFDNLGLYTEPADDALVTNGSFERTAPGVITDLTGGVEGWVFEVGASVETAPEFAIVDDVAYHGEQSLRVTIHTAGANSWNIQAIADSIPVTPGATYHYSVWARTESGTGTAAFTVGSYGPAFTEYFAQRDNITITEEWQEFIGQFTLPSTVASHVRAPIHFSMAANVGQVIYIDNLVIEGVPPVSNEPTGLPLQITLGQNYPNPFHSSTKIEYEVGTSSHVSLTVYNTLGQRVATLVDQVQTAGTHDVRFDADGLASGVYFYRITVGDLTRTRQMLLVK